MQPDQLQTRKLRSKRFELVPMTVEDAPLFAELAADTEIIKTLIGDWSTAGKRLENARAWIATAADYVLWGIYDRDGTFGEAGNFIGICGLEAPLPKVGKGPGLYFAFERTAWGKGAGSEIAATVIDFLFDDTEAEAVEALVFPRINPASSRLLEKQGMRLVGRYPVADYVGDDCLPTVNYEIWRAQVAGPAEARDCIHEAAFKIGQFVGEGISSIDEMSAALLVSAHENGLVEKIGIDAARQVIAEALQAGMAEDGWLYYRIECNARQSG